MNEQELEALFSSRSQVRGGERFYDVPTAFDFVNECSKNDFAILGLDGFELKGSTVIPKLDQIADFSQLASLPWDEFKARSGKAAQRFLAQATGRDLYFTFTVESRAEHGD